MLKGSITNRLTSCYVSKLNRVSYQVCSVGPIRINPRKVITADRGTLILSDLSITNCQWTMIKPDQILTSTAKPRGIPNMLNAIKSLLYLLDISIS